MVCTCYTALPTHLAELWASIKLRSCFGAFYGSYVGLQHEAHVHDAQAEVPFLLWSCWPLLLVCLTFIVWQNPNAWYVACYIKSNPINQGRSNRETVAKYMIVSLLALFSRGICSTYYHLYVLMPWRVKMLIIMMWRKNYHWIYSWAYNALTQMKSRSFGVSLLLVTCIWVAVPW